MKNLRHALLVGAFALGLSAPQVVLAAPITATVAADGSCPAGTVLRSGNDRPLYGTNTGALCVNASVTATATINGFTQEGTGTPITATTGGVTGTLPTGDVVIAINTDASNPVYCKPGASATVNDTYIAPGGGWFPFTVGAATQLTCITSTGTAKVNTVGGSGMPTGTGGGSGAGGGGGAVTIADGANVTQGAKTDAKSTATDATSVTVMQVLKEISAMEQAPASRAVTNAGTFAVQAAQSTAANLNATVVQSTAANLNATAAQGGTWTVQPGNTPNTSPWLTTDSGTVAQGSTTSGQVGALVQGAVTTAAPTYTTGKTDPLSLDTSGSLRVSVVSGSTGNAAASATGSAVPAQAGYTGLNNGGNLIGWVGDSGGAGQVAIASGKVASGAFASGSIANGADVVEGTNTDSASCASGSSVVSCLRQIHADTSAAIPAGTATIGYVGGDGAAGTASTHVLTIQGVSGMTHLLVTPDANSATNTAQINGVTPLMGNGVTGTGSQRVTIASDNSPVPAKIDQTTPGTTNNVTISTNVGTLPLVQATASAAISSTSAGGPTQLIAASGSTKIYVTHYDIVLSGAGTFAWVTGTGTNCGTGTAYLTGAASHPMSFAANGGISAGGGLGPILITGAGGELCYITTGAVDISGSVSYAQF